MDIPGRLKVGDALCAEVGFLQWLLGDVPGDSDHFRGEVFMGIMILDSIC